MKRNIILITILLIILIGVVYFLPQNLKVPLEHLNITHLYTEDDLHNIKTDDYNNLDDDKIQKITDILNDISYTREIPFTSKYINNQIAIFYPESDFFITIYTNGVLNISDYSYVENAKSHDFRISNAESIINEILEILKT